MLARSVPDNGRTGGTIRRGRRPRDDRRSHRVVRVLSGAEPPESTLGSGDRTVTGVLGGYCWSSGSGGECVDAVYPLVPGKEKALAVPVGSDMVFDYGGEGPPDAVRAKAEPLGPGGEPTGSFSRPLGTGGSRGRVTIPAELPPSGITWWMSP